MHSLRELLTSPWNVSRISGWTRHDTKEDVELHSTHDGPGIIPPFSSLQSETHCYVESAWNQSEQSPTKAGIEVKKGYVVQ